jgi:biotin--protein ligase
LIVGVTQGNTVDVRIKWPNDIYAQQLKIGGVLCQSAYRDQKFQVVIGVGLNVSNRDPTTCINAIVKERHSELGLEGEPLPVQPEVCLNVAFV